MVSIFPQFETDASVASEMIFLVDRSGSMEYTLYFNIDIYVNSGKRIEAVKATLQLLLRSLPESCLFNILSFGIHEISQKSH